MLSPLKHMRCGSLKSCVTLVFAVLLIGCVSAAAGSSLSLAGVWRFQLDREDAGVAQRWFERSFEQRLRLPGALQNQGYGDDITVDTKWTGDVGAERWLSGPQYAPYRQPGNIKVPFFLQPEKHYVGVAWYQREIEIPKAWEGKRIVLTLERAHWETRVWVDARDYGTNTSLCTPHVYDLGTQLSPGKHALTLRVDNRLVVNVGSWAHSVSDHTQGNWNGVVGRIGLSATSPVWLDDVQVYPDPERNSALVKVKVGNATGQPGAGTLTVDGQARPVKWDATGGAAQTEVSLGEKPKTWDEFRPALQKFSVRLKGEQADDERSITFGLRRLDVAGRDFILNGRKLFFRGTLECCIFPLTGYPPTDVESWKRLIRVCQAHGLNHIRFHSWCPPEAAFAAADDLGFYLSVEIAAWTAVGDGQPIDQWLYDEAARVLKSYGNHPSFMLMPYGNEPGGRRHREWLGQWVNHWKQADPRRLYTSASGWPAIPENQYHVTPNPRGPKGWLGKDYRADIETGRSRRDSVREIEVPVIVHEMGQWCVYPNFDEINKYTGPLKPQNFEIFRDSLAAHGMLDQWRDFLRASGKLQALCYKEEIEAALRTPGIGGFQLLDLHDFPGQGTALVGVLDPFWDSKGYITAAEYRRFCNSVVPLARVMKRTWTTAETFSAEVEVANFGPTPIEHAVAAWKLVTPAGKVLAAGELPRQTGTPSGKTIPLGQGTAMGRIELSLAQLPAPSTCRLVVGLKGTRFENDWNVWVYPSNTQSAGPADVLLTTNLDAAALAQLDAGGKVLLLPAKLSYQHPRLGFEPIFWNHYMFNTQPRQTLGLLCNPRHPALAGFPTEFFQDWQWDEIVSRARGMTLDELPRPLRPIVQVIDDWNTNRKLGLVWECRVGRGRLLVCSADLSDNLEQRPAARQLRASLLQYMGGKDFDPKVEVGKEELARLLATTTRSQLVKLGARVLETDSEDSTHGNVASKAIDGDPDTFWHTRWEPDPAPMPHHLTIDLGAQITLRGITYLPRQDMANGRVAQCDIYCSNDAKAWGEPCAKARWPNSEQLQTVLFKQPLKARFLKVVARSEVNGNPFASIAELDILPAE